MPWGRLDDGLYDHPKLEALGRVKLQAIGLWTLAISWSNRRLSDGFVSEITVRKLGGTKQIAERLVEAGLFDRVEQGYEIHDFLVFNESKFQVDSRREADRNRKRKADGNQPDSSGSPNDPPARAGSRPVPSYTRPIEETPKSPHSGDQPKGNQRANGTNLRALGKSPRQLAAVEANGAAESAHQRRLERTRRETAELREVLEKTTPKAEPWEDSGL